jgi:hypothetical protein
MSFLAIGVSCEHEGFCASNVSEMNDPQIVADSLAKDFGLYFEQILLVQNDSVVHHWNIDKDFIEK